MNKKFMSIIAAAAVMISGSPMIANALYTELISKQDRSDYTKIDFVSDEQADIYISNADISDSEKPYYHRGIHDYKYSDRIYFNLKDGSELSDVDGLLKDFRTENGDSLKCCNTMINEHFGHYYLTPSFDETYLSPKKISVNDARKIKEILTKSDIVTDILYTDSVCSPSNGQIDLSLYHLTSLNYTESNTEEFKKTVSEKAEQVKEYLTEKEIEATITVYSEIRITPVNVMSLTEQLDFAEQLYNDLDLKPFMMWDLSASESIGAIDLMNAVDGDSNCDEQMDMADAVLIMQSLANPDKYQLTDQGKFNADLNGDGITVGDAQKIQEMLLGIG
ncbi:MAG: hypothetical protein IIT39_10175 [Clostridia bacterium]|jgi:hypothetical protein|nr:hypothetical protein [Clostridia bacterium]